MYILVSSFLDEPAIMQRVHHPPKGRIKKRLYDRRMPSRISGIVDCRQRDARGQPTYGMTLIMIDGDLSYTSRRSEIITNNGGLIYAPPLARIAEYFALFFKQFSLLDFRAQTQE